MILHKHKKLEITEIGKEENGGESTGQLTGCCCSCCCFPFWFELMMKRRRKERKIFLGTMRLKSEITSSSIPRCFFGGWLDLDLRLKVCWGQLFGLVTGNSKNFGLG